MSLNDFNNNGYLIINNYLKKIDCENLLDIIGKYSKNNEIPKIYRKFNDRSLNYSVIDGIKIKHKLPKIYRYYLEVNKVVNKMSNNNYISLTDHKVCVNVNITPKYGEYRWHYDRNAVTAILYLNKVKGGELEMYPNYRIIIKNKKHTNLQKWFDAILQIKLIRIIIGKKVVIKPKQGMLVIMRGDKCLHSVKKVLSEGKRINIIFAFDVPGAKFPMEEKLNNYLYSRNKVISNDPNYA